MNSKNQDGKALVSSVGAWVFNVSTSVGIIMVNKLLLSVYDFKFATTLTGCHFLMTTFMMSALKYFGYISGTPLPITELLKFAITANISVVGMNVSLMWNSVGFYQISKLSMIPVSCLMEVVFDSVRYSRNTKLSILVVLCGVAICTVSDISMNAKGFVTAAIAVWSTSLQQYYVHSLQKKYAIGSFDLLAQTAPVQALMLVIFGPLVDFALTRLRIDRYEFSVPSLGLILLSCLIAIGVNLSQFICIGKFSAVSFQVLGHMKTVLVLILGFTIFGKDNFNIKILLGMVMAILGMIWYGSASTKPGGKEKFLPSIPQTEPAIPLSSLPDSEKNTGTHTN